MVEICKALAKRLHLELGKVVSKEFRNLLYYGCELRHYHNELSAIGVAVDAANIIEKLLLQCGHCNNDRVYIVFFFFVDLCLPMDYGHFSCSDVVSFD